MNFRWSDQKLCKFNLERGPRAQTREQRPAGPPFCFVDLYQQMPRRDSNPAYFSIVNDLCTAYEMSDWSTGFLPLRGVYHYQRNQHRNWAGKGRGKK
jgi:hypothetical protein